MITVYGVPGWGSTISELMLSLADIPYEVVDVEGFDQPGPARERLRQINPLCQVPTLRLADGSIMTEEGYVQGFDVIESQPRDILEITMRAISTSFLEAVFLVVVVFFLAAGFFSSLGAAGC